MTCASYRSGGRFEIKASYVRAKRVGPFIYVSGTTAIEPSGKIHSPGNSYQQSLYIFQLIEEAIQQVGGKLAHVVRTRAYLQDMQRDGAGFIQAHGEVFQGIEPVTCAVEAGLTRPELTVEIEVDAVLVDAEGNILLQA